jgi:hypothetical protein
VEVGEIPRTKQPPEANLLAICVVFRGYVKIWGRHETKS